MLCSGADDDKAQRITTALAAKAQRATMKNSRGGCAVLPKIGDALGGASMIDGELTDHPILVI